jgi:hypothetical protein
MPNWFSLGQTLYECATKIQPASRIVLKKGANMNNIQECRARNCDVAHQMPLNLAPQLKEMLHRLTRAHPHCRSGKKGKAEELKKCRFLSKYNWFDLLTEIDLSQLKRKEILLFEDTPKAVTRETWTDFNFARELEEVFSKKLKSKK